LTLNIIVGLLLFETLLHFLRRILVRETGQTGISDRPHAYDLAARCLRMGVLVASAVIVAQAWIVDVFGFVAPDQWQALTRSGFRAGLTIFLSYVAWQIINFFAARYAPTQLAVAPGARADAQDSSDAPSRSTRLITLVPLLKFFLGATIAVVAVLIVLSELGVNITPLLAGASVFGLAISFGSQTLVRDIVSGVFYLADDAFRVGEYIDCGKAKGMVEGFTLRSIRLRHQNGPVHTIPFGQLGQITNFSRGWSVVKFNLRFARDTDMDKVRKLVKQIGLEMMDDPELKIEMIQPLKMMGVVEIADSALVVRFKFTVRPSNPGMVQREAMMRMVRAFPEAGIEFSNGTATVQHVGGHPDAAAAAVTAAESLTLAPAPVPVRAA
jgi:small-conductance mechanosensitive channel